MIRVLDKNVADKIAAGEVIDRPVSIVKELVENSLDADARSITVEIRKGGKEYLRVTDDGCGIPAGETELAFRRHATSKIETEHDLDSIHSLGFRGEALASICAVARVDMITKEAHVSAGRHIVAEGSEILRNTATGCPDGTTITVRDLFYNVPARKKFLGTDGAESRRVIDMMSRIALSYPDVRFRLISGRQEIFQTSGKGSILDNIIRIYGRDIGRDLVKVDACGEEYILRGFVSSPGVSSSSRNRQFFCVNGRVVASKTIERGLEKAYRERLFPGRFPLAFLFLQVPADQLDVNVHPTKKEIRFDKEYAVEDFITDAVFAALSQKQAIPAAGKGAPVTGEDKGTEEPAQAAADGQPQLTVQEHTQFTAGETGHAPVESIDRNRSARIFSPEEDSQQVDIKKLLETMRLKSQVRDIPFSEGALQGAPKGESDIDTASEGESLAIDQLDVIGSVLNTYILATDGASLYLIDQHAAHERVFYEKLLKQYRSQEKYQQEMLLPLQITVPADVENAEDLWIGYLREMGYDIENFGNRMYLVRALPAFARPEEAEGFLRQMLIEIESTPDLHSFATLDRLIMRSCKSAIKGGDVLHPEEIHELMVQLAACERPWSCPHGRPTIVRMTKYDLEKMFKRQG